MRKSGKAKVFYAIVLAIIIIIAIGFLKRDRSPQGIPRKSFITKLKRITMVTAERIQGYNLSMREAMWYRKLADGDVQCFHHS